jgi:hypothetical protein
MTTHSRVVEAAWLKARKGSHVADLSETSGEKDPS